ncbi:hypothetical protein EV196_101573 [Mariniflexile fucanivorans]|uniref:Uncharacterized protein n=1 Tax=Mariniflexile fucanivorans TaxID=264023 RepID=A0A4R1RS56_9FLAO|nr:hypothetical protein [Mariniflexile fucanivorans]TCL69139.1 hypothetical protein EV196_101573 [Mariniflexile fucanivorans]
MKNVLNNSKKGILMVTLFATMLSFANEVSLFKIENDAERTSLTLNDVKQGNLLSIKDNNGVVIYKELIEQSGTYTKGFDLTELPNGGYIFELDKDVEINTIPFTVLSNTVTFKKEMEATIFKPVTRVKGNVVFVSRLSLNKAPMKIAIYFTDSQNNFSTPELIYSETVENTENASRIYKLASKNSGDYKIVFTTEDRVFTTEIN